MGDTDVEDSCCLQCHNEVRWQDAALMCDGCDRWCHLKCGIGKILYNYCNCTATGSNCTATENVD
jgi:hypothetical protein